MNHPANNHIDERELHYQSLMSCSDDESINRHLFARIIASWLSGKNALPDYLGLAQDAFQQLCLRFFPTMLLPDKATTGIILDYARMPEKEDLIILLKADAKDDSEETNWVIDMIVAACLGSDHLWQDLGVWQRAELTTLIAYNFPALAKRNNKNMKWKKFLYKQMCEAEGLYVCRSPSCEVCADYNECFDVGDA